MIKPVIPKNEKRRLEAILAYDLHNQGQHPEFNDIVDLAAYICDTPISLISIVESDQQKFIGNHGLPVDSTERNVSFCAHAINHIHQPFIVEDATKDERFKDNPLVTGEPNIVFYAGFPLYTADDYALGSLCVIDVKPKTLNEHQKKGLQLLTKQIIRLFELRKTIKEADEKEKMLQLSVSGLEEYTAIVAHDLKTSLRSIEISTELLKKKNEKHLDDNCKAYLASIEGETTESIRFINDMLKFSKSVYSYNDDRSLIDMEKIIEGILTKLNVSTHFKFKIPVPLPKLYTSRTAIQHIFENLIQNSIKYMDKEKPTIEIRYKSKRKYHTFLVIDNGCGIAKSRQQAIFTLFNKAQKGEGSGIGLAIVSRLTTLLGGKIKVKSKLKKGTTFTIKIPKDIE